MKKGDKKGGLERSQKNKKKDLGSLNHGKKDLSHLKCFRCHNCGHYGSQCLEKKGNGKEQQRKQFAGSIEV